MIDFEIEQIAESLHVFRSQRCCNIGVCVSGGKALVIDATGSPVYARALIETISDNLNCTIELLFLTHYHSDHTFGNQAFDCPILAAEECLTMMKHCLATHWHPDEIRNAMDNDPFLADVWQDLTITLPTRTFRERMDFDFHGIEVVFETLPGHTRDSSVAYFPRHKLIFAGDVIFGRRYPTLLEHDAEPFRLIRSLQKMKKLDADTLVPGHGDTDDNSLIDFSLDYWQCLMSNALELIRSGAEESAAVGTLLSQCRLEGVVYDEMRHKRNIISVLRHLLRRNK
jgi:glyoxylase-like metal-dependent hydrolase (beta-lactamase superfamily II)